MFDEIEDEEVDIFEEPAPVEDEDNIRERSLGEVNFLISLSLIENSHQSLI